MSKRCTYMNDDDFCITSTLGFQDWCEVDPAMLYGPDQNKRCFDINELLHYFEIKLSGTKFGNPYPQYPENPWTREPFRLDEIFSFINRISDEKKKEYPFLFHFLLAIQTGILDWKEYDGIEFGNRMDNVIDVLPFEKVEDGSEFDEETDESVRSNDYDSEYERARFTAIENIRQMREREQQQNQSQPFQFGQQHNTPQIKFIQQQNKKKFKYKQKLISFTDLHNNPQQI